MCSLIITYGQQSFYTFSDECGMQYIFYFENLLRSLSLASTTAQLLPKLPTLQGTSALSFLRCVIPVVFVQITRI